MPYLLSSLKPIKPNTKVPFSTGKVLKSKSPPRDLRSSPNLETKTVSSPATEATAMPLPYELATRPGRGYKSDINHEMAEAGYRSSVFAPHSELYQPHQPLNLSYYPHILHPAVHAHFLQQQYEVLINSRQKNVDRFASKIC